MGLLKLGSAAIVGSAATLLVVVGPTHMGGAVHETAAPVVSSVERLTSQVNAQIASLQKGVSDATLTSPVAGIVTTKLVDAGEVIAARTPVVVVTDLDHAWANVYVDEPVVPRLRLGQKVVLVTDAGQRLDGVITFISPKAEFTPRNVQTAAERSRLVYRIKVTAENKAGILKSGMPVEAELPEQS